MQSKTYNKSLVTHKKATLKRPILKQKILGKDKSTHVLFAKELAKNSSKKLAIKSIADSPKNIAHSQKIDVTSRLLEALLFTTEKTISLEEITTSLNSSTKLAKDLINNLNDFYTKTGRAFYIFEQDESYQLRAAPEFSSWLSKNKLTKKITLSTKVLECLTIVAYRQPITKQSIDKLKVCDSSYSLSVLLKKNLVYISGRSKKPGRPLIYRTTQFFLQMFGLEDIKNLPKPNELDTIVEV